MSYFFNIYIFALRSIFCKYNNYIHKKAKDRYYIILIIRAY